MHMTIVRCAALVFLITVLGHGQSAQERHQIDSSSHAEFPVRRLYQQLMSRPTGGIPTPKRMRLFAPYLSSSLLHSITQARACGDDWFRQRPQNNVKAPLEWLEFGLFSGANDRTGLHTFQIEKFESKDDGSFRA
jgi:hypothetical protein